MNESSWQVRSAKKMLIKRNSETHQMRLRLYRGSTHLTAGVSCANCLANCLATTVQHGASSPHAYSTLTKSLCLDHAADLGVSRSHRRCRCHTP